MQTVIRLLLFITGFVSFALAADPGFIPDSEAAQHIGEEAIVRGTIAQLKIAKGGAVFLDMGGRYPNQTFTVWITASAYRVTTDRAWLEALKGKTVDVKGRIQEYNGKPEIRVMDESQVIEVIQ
jgi:DNA/RNA endonuclease YhcR with UshA esterase domain